MRNQDTVSERTGPAAPAADGPVRRRRAPGVLALVLVAAILPLAGCSKSSSSTSPTSDDSGGTASDTTGSYTQSGGTATKTGQTYTASATNESGVLVTDGGTLTLTCSTITTSGGTTSADSSSFYGLDAGVLANDGSAIHLSNCSVATTGTGANGVFACGSGTSITMVSDTVVCTGRLGHGVDATGGATMTLTDCVITTGTGANSAAIATDRGGGTITVTRGTMTTSGADAPGIYSTGTITVNGAVISASASEAAVIEGENSITLTSASLSGGKKRGVMIYQSMSGDAEGEQGTFTMTGGSLAAAVGPLFYVTNATAIITLTGVTTTATSGTLLSAAADTWGTSGSNGGTAVLTTSGQTLAGSLVADAISSITVALANGSTLSGAINTANTAKTIALSLDGASTWNVTADSYLTTLSDAAGISGTAISNIVGNGHTVYYVSASNSSLGGLTYMLSNGGSLVPR